MDNCTSDSWTLTTLGAIAKRLVSGGTPPTKNQAYWTGSIPWITGADFTHSGLAEFRRFVSEDAVERTATSVIEKDALLIVTRTGVGKLAIAPCDIAISQDITGVYPDQSQVDVEFLYHRMRQGVEDLRKLNQGTSINGIVRKDLLDYPLSLPSLTQQHQIAAILSTLDRAIDQTEALIAKQQRIKTGLMQDLLTRGIDEHGNLRSEQTHQFKVSPLGRIPVEWKVERIEQRLDRIVDYRGRTPTKVEAGVPLLTAKNVRDGYLDEEPREFIAESDFNSWMTRGIPTPGDVLFTTEAPMGNVALVPEYRIALAQRLLTLCPKPNELSQDYLFWLLHWRHSTERLELLTSGSTVVGVKQSVFRKVEFTFPGLEEQRRISAILNSFDSASESQRSKLTKLRSLKTALMQDLLTGKRHVTSLGSHFGEVNEWCSKKYARRHNNDRALTLPIEN